VAQTHATECDRPRSQQCPSRCEDTKTVMPPCLCRPGPRTGALRIFLLSLLCFACLISGCSRHERRADIVILNGAEPESLDPAIVTGQPDMRVVTSLFEGLTRFDAHTGRAAPGVAESWEKSPDERIYTFHLRSNAVWSTGEPITAEDFVYSWRRVLDPAMAAEYAGQLFYLKNGEEFNSGRMKDFSQVGVHVINEHTLGVELNSPAAFFIKLCALPALAIVPRLAIEKNGDRWLLSHPLPVSGAYLLEDWRIHDKIRLRKNPRYWEAAQTKNEVVDFLPIDSANLALNLYSTGEADIIWDKNLIPTELMDILAKRPDCHRYDYLGIYFIRFNVTREPLDNVRVRQAMVLAVDRQRIVQKIARAGERVATQFTPPGIANYVPPEGLGNDPERARRLLAQAGYPGGKGFPSFQYLFNAGKLNEQIGIELQEMWRKELGINVELRQMECKVYLPAQSELDYDLSRSSWIADYDDPNTFLDIWMSNNPNNRTGWKNARYDQLLREGNMQLDPRKREKLLQEAETLLVRDEVPILPLWFYKGIAFFDDRKIGGIYFNILDEHPVNAIEKRKSAGNVQPEPPSEIGRMSPH